MDTRHILWSGLGALALITTATAAGAQDTHADARQGASKNERDMPSTAKEASRAAHFVALEKIDGADVRMRAQDDDDGDAKRPKGEIDDVLVRPSTGELGWAVISFDETLGMGGKTVAVPMSELSWNAEESCFDLAATKAELESLPKFDLDAARRNGLDRAIAVVEASWTDVGRPTNGSMREASQRSDARHGTDGEDDAQPRIVHGSFVAVAAPVEFAAASEISDLDVHAKDEKFGKVSKCIVDSAQGELAYVVVSRGGIAGIGDEHYLLPFGALRLCHEDGDAKALVLCADRTVEELKRVKYEKPDEGVLDAQAARMADETFRRP